MPPKIWRPKPDSKYIPLQYSDDIDEAAFDFSKYGKTVFRPSVPWVDRSCSDLIQFDKATDQQEFDKDLNLGSHLTPFMRDEIVRIVTKYWDCFCKRGAQRTILDYEFAVDTGAAKPVCCKNPSYGHYESKIIMTQVEQLLDNDWITECKQGSWGSMIVLAPKPHQETVTDIQDFVWRMCVSYRKLNSVTKPFEYPIPRCDDAVTIVMVGSTVMWIITVDARQGYHQVAV